MFSNTFELFELSISLGHHLLMPRRFPLEKTTESQKNTMGKKNELFFTLGFFKFGGKILNLVRCLSLQWKCFFLNYGWARDDSQPWSCWSGTSQNTRGREERWFSDAGLFSLEICQQTWKPLGSLLKVKLLSTSIARSPAALRPPAVLTKMAMTNRIGLSIKRKLASSVWKREIPRIWGVIPPP